MNNYPLGADNDPRAPWNQSKPSEMEIEVWASNTLSRKAYVLVDDYKVLPPDSERDEDGNITHSHNIDFSECNLKEAYRKQYYTIKEVLAALQEVTESINEHGLNDTNLRRLNRLARENNYWTVDEEEVIKA